MRVCVSAYIAAHSISLVQLQRQWHVNRIGSILQFIHIISGEGQCGILVYLLVVVCGNFLR